MAPVPNPQGNAAAIALRDVSYKLPGGAELIESLSLEVPAGITLVLLGRSGSGKTTTLKLMNRLLEPTSGELSVEGKRAADWDVIRLRRHMGYAIQDVGLFPHYTVERNIGLLPSVEGWPAERVRARVKELMTLVDLDPAILPRFPRELSGGQRQRVGVARALALDPPVMLMDEPFGALDPITRSELQGEFARLQNRLGKTVVLVTHDLREALRLATRIAFLEAGRLVGVYTPAEFLRAADPLTTAYRNAFSTAEAASEPPSGSAP